MGLGLAFTDVLADAVMVENGRQHGLTGAFQSVQWASIYISSMLVGLIGGWLAQRRNLVVAFLVAACFPLITLLMTAAFVRRAAGPPGSGRARRAPRRVRTALRARATSGWWPASSSSSRSVPSFGPGFLYYQTDRLGFSQQFIGVLNAVQSFGSVLGALTYAPLSRRWPLRRTINLSIGLSAAGTHHLPALPGAVVGRRDRLHVRLDLHGDDAGASGPGGPGVSDPRRGHVFALLMSVYNAGIQGSQWTGGHLYDSVGFERLVLISTAATLLTFILVPFVHVDRIEAVAAGGRGRRHAAPEPHRLTTPACHLASKSTSRTRGRSSEH